MTKRADLGRKLLFCTNSCTFLKTANKWCAPCENDKRCWSCAEITVLYKQLCTKQRTSLCKTAFSARDQHVFSPTSVGLVLLTLSAPHLCDFKQSARVCTKQRFESEVSTFWPFRTGRTTFERLQLNALVSAHKSFPPEISRSCVGTGRTTFCNFRTWYNTF